MRSDTMLNLCHALRHNFFSDLAAKLPQDYERSAVDLRDTTIAEQLKKMKWENDLLKEIIAKRG